MFSKTRNLLSSLGILATLWTPCLGQRVIYVDARAIEATDGTSWGDAYRDLQDALDDVSTNGACPCDIWVAAGTYKPDRSTGDRTKAFEVPDGVSLYGGFAGWEDAAGEREWSEPTILDGDLLGNDDPLYVAPDPCCTFQSGAGCGDAKCFERMSQDGSRCAEAWSPTCATDAQWACCDLCRPTRCDNSFGVVWVPGSGDGVIIDGVTIKGGEANRDDPLGKPGAGIRAGVLTSIVVRNCTFRHNAGGGAAIDIAGLVAEDCLFEENFAFGEWAVVRGRPIGSHPFSLRGCAFQDNHALPLLVSNHGGLTDIRNSSFIANEFGGILANGGQVVIHSSSFAYNGGTAIHNFAFGAALVLTDSILIDNHDETRTGGVIVTGPSLVQNCLFAANGGALESRLGITRIANSSFVGNVGLGLGGGVSSAADDPTEIESCIFWANSDETGGGDAAQVFVYPAELLEINNSIVQNWTGMYGGTGNSGADPHFLDPLGADNVVATGDEDYRLSPDSPGINAGAITANTPDNDLDGHARVLCGAVDLGPYEFGIGDYDCDREITAADFAAWPWCMDGPTVAVMKAGEALTLALSQRERGPIGCEALDFNADNRVDLSDFAAFQCLLTP